MWFLSGLFFFILLPSTFSQDREWWENANYYQIYPRSFKDSDGNGIGDLQGIKEKAQYLKDLGMDGVWLSPIMKSPMADFGYDISDYRQIDSTFGGMTDFEELLEEFKRLGLHLILDFVPNHTSDEHEWFKKSVKRESGFENFYVWQPGKFNATGHRVPPNNWVSHFFGSAWEWNEARQEYYLHNFHKKQPDLNYRDANVVREMKEVLRYWLKKGVAGFRIDVMNHLFEYKDDQGRFPDEPLSGDCDDHNDYCYLNHIYTLDHPETFNMTYQWREVLDEFSFPPRVMMTEAYSPLANIMRYMGNDQREGSHIPFNFEFLTKITNTSSARDLKTIAEGYLGMLPSGKSGNWVLGNHDQRRIASRLGSSRVDLYNTLLQTLPGHAITYYGEELGMQDVFISWEDTKDPQACNTNNRSIYNLYSRDPARTPFQWDGTKNGGFSSSDKTWLPVASDYAKNNIKNQLADSNSHLRVFKRLVETRKKPAFRFGEYRSALIGDVFAYLRKSENETYVVALNLGNSDATVDLKSSFPNLADTIRVLVAPKLTEGSSFKVTEVKIPAESSLVGISRAISAKWSLIVMAISLFATRFIA